MGPTTGMLSPILSHLLGIKAHATQLAEYVASLFQNTLADPKSRIIVLLGMMVILLSYRLGSTSRSHPLHTQSASPSKSSLSSRSKTSSCPTTSLTSRIHETHTDGTDPDPDPLIPRDLAHLLSQLRGPLIAYEGPHPSGPLLRLIHPLGSLWPKRYYDAFTQAMVEAGEGSVAAPAVRLERGMVRRDLEYGVVFMVNKEMSVDELLGNRWRGVVWFDDEL